MVFASRVTRWLDRPQYFRPTSGLFMSALFMSALFMSAFFKNVLLRTHQPPNRPPGINRQIG